MMKFLDLKFKAFGLDINDSSLKIAMFQKKKNGFYIDSLGELKMDPGLIINGAVNNEDALAKAIKTLYGTVKGKKLKTRYAVCSLPEEESFLQVIQMPKMSEDELKSAILFEAENYIPLPIDQVYLDFQIITPLEKVSDHCDVLFVAMPKKIVDTYFSCIRKAGLIPLAFEVESQSISRALIKNEMCEQPIVILDIGQNNTDFVVFSGRSTRFTYSIPTSSSQLTNAIAEALAVSPKEAERLKVKHGLEGKEGSESKAVLKVLWPILDDFASNIKKHIDFYQEHTFHEHLLSKEEVRKIIICGGGANLKGLVEFLSQRLGVGVEVGDPFVNFGEKPKDENIGKINFSSFTSFFFLAQRAADFEGYEY